MIFRGFDKSGDWLFGNGLNSYARNNDAILLNLVTKLKTFLGECFFDTTIGIPWFDLINLRNKDIIVLTIKGAIIETYGIITVNELSYDFDLNRKLTIKYNINTLYMNNVLGLVEI